MNVYDSITHTAEGLYTSSVHTARRSFFNLSRAVEERSLLVEEKSSHDRNTSSTKSTDMPIKE